MDAAVKGKNGRPSVVDSDGHILERESDIRKYLEPPWDQRRTSLWPGDQPWDNNLFGSFDNAWRKKSPAEQVELWQEVMEKEGMEAAVCFPTGSGNVAKLREVPFQIAVARACNTFFAREYNSLSDRVHCVGVLPLRSPQAAAEELRRAATELSLKGFEILTTGLSLALGDSFYDPIYAEAERLGVVLGIHGTRHWGREVGAESLATFAEVHAYAFTAALLLQFTSIVCQGVPVRFPKLKLAFLEIGATWIPYYLDRLDEHWEKRGKFEMPHLKKKPSDIVRGAKMYFSLEAGETLLPQTIDYLGAEHFLYASDIPHWDNEFPRNIEEIWHHPNLPVTTKEKVLYKNAKELFQL